MDVNQDEFNRTVQETQILIDRAEAAIVYRDKGLAGGEYLDDETLVKVLEAMVEYEDTRSECERCVGSVDLTSEQERKRAQLENFQNQITKCEQITSQELTELLMDRKDSILKRAKQDIVGLVSKMESITQTNLDQIYHCCLQKAVQKEVESITLSL